MGRTIVIAGTAQAVTGNVAARQNAAAQQQAAAAPEVVAQLTQLGAMNTAGLVDNAEFSAAKEPLGI